MTLLAIKTPLTDIMDYTGHSNAKTMEHCTTVNQRTLSEVTARIHHLYPEIGVQIKQQPQK